tara:strand:+ start:841 stop:1131 length:291 start_codon:yes stop_codon:yes gene_type:complete
LIVVTRFEKECDWEELIVEFGEGGEPIRYARRVFDPDFEKGHDTDHPNELEISPAQYARFWAFAQKRIGHADWKVLVGSGSSVDRATDFKAQQPSI